MKIIVAIDGFAASGKSTIAQDLAEKTEYTHIDSGAKLQLISFLGELMNSFYNLKPKYL